MLETALSGFLDGSIVEVISRVGAVAVGFALGVRLLAPGGSTADERSRILLDAARGRAPLTRRGVKTPGGGIA